MGGKAAGIRLHVLGAGFGESIVLEMPLDKSGQPRWGVVDCFSVPSGGGKHEVPPLALLRKHKVAKLDFACLSHPHLDHCSGFCELLDNVKVKEWWESGVPCSRDIVARLTKHLSKSKHLEWAGLDRELSGIEARTKKLQSEPMMGFNSDRFSYESSDGSIIRVASFSPLGQQYRLGLKQITKAWRELDRLRKAKASKADSLEVLRQASNLYNRMSIILSLSYGKTRVILGADADEHVWQSVLKHEKRKQADWPLSCILVKVSHHGSEGSFVEAVWNEHGAPTAVVTPYAMQADPLPRSKMLSKIKKHAKLVHVTPSWPAPGEPDWAKLKRSFKNGTLTASVLDDSNAGFSLSISAAGKVGTPVAIKWKELGITLSRSPSNV